LKYVKIQKIYNRDGTVRSTQQNINTGLLLNQQILVKAQIERNKKRECAMRGWRFSNEEMRRISNKEEW
jgi:hypothetical protein